MGAVDAAGSGSGTGGGADGGGGTTVTSSAGVAYQLLWFDLGTVLFLKNPKIRQTSSAQDL